MLRRGELESAVRAAVIFGDEHLAQALEDVSNGLEHGYATFPDLQRAAADIRDEACARLRDAIIATLELSPLIRDELLDDSYQRPARTEPIGSGLAGKLLGDTTPLATGDYVPFLSDSADMTIVVRERSDGSYSFSHTYQGRVDNLPEGMVFQIEGGVFSGSVANVRDVSVT